MNLEDHLGDIIRKARAMSNVSMAAAAQAAGLNETELAALEDSGQVAKKPDYTKLAPLIGLQPQKLQSIAEGWLPSEKDLRKWPELRPLATAAEGITVNCYLVWDEISREAALFAKSIRGFACIPAQKTRRWTSGTAQTISFTSAACASLIATRPGMPRMA